MTMNGMFDPNSKPVTLEEMIACVRREIAMRKNVYPKWVAAKRMKQESADNEIRVMQAVHDAIGKPIDAELSAAREAIRKAGRLIEMVAAHIDEQTYDEKRNRDFNAHADDEFDIFIRSKDERALDEAWRALLAIEPSLREEAPEPLIESASQADRIATLERQLAEMQEALDSLGEHSAKLKPHEPDDHHSWVLVRNGDLRRAAKAVGK